MSRVFCQDPVRKVINSLWIGSKISTLELLSIQSFLNKSHDYHLWTFQKIENLPKEVIIRDAREFLPESEVWSYQRGEGTGSVSACSNTFRYKLLYELGGWWCDTDVVCLKPFQFTDPYVFASERSKNGSSCPASCIIYAEPHSSVMEECFNIAQAADKEATKWGAIGPKLLMRSIFKYGLENYVLPVEAFCPVNWFEAEIDPTIPNCPDLTSSYSVHLWHEMWRRKGIDKDASYTKECLFERLKNDVF